MNEFYLIRTSTRPHFYIAELRGVVWISWTTDIEFAAKFPANKLYKWLSFVNSNHDFECEKFFLD